MTLTKRQIEIADALCAGLSAKEVAVKLNVSFHCIEHTREAIYMKTGSHSLMQLFWYLVRNKIGDTYEQVRLATR